MKFYQAFKRNQHQSFPNYSTKYSRNVNIPTSIMKLVFLPWWQNQTKMQQKEKNTENCGSLRDGSCRGPFVSQHPDVGSIFCSSSLTGSNVLLWPSQHCTHVAHRHTCSQNTQTHAIETKRGRKRGIAVKWNQARLVRQRDRYGCLPPTWPPTLMLHNPTGGTEKPTH